jgi:metal-dependent amidase/aminoacylase/carboxypeptidase family protein
MDVKEQVNGIQEELVALRRHFHEHPERSWKEFETQKYIMEYLGKLGIPCVKACKSGVIATIKGPHSSDKIIGIPNVPFLNPFEFLRVFRI